MKLSQFNILLLTVPFFFISSIYSVEGKTIDNQKASNDMYKEYIDYLDKVYDTMDKNYYKDVSRESYNQFLDKFKTEIYVQLKKEGKSNDYIRWRSASYMIQDLRMKEDIFSEFYPPKPAQEYKQSALGQKIDLGIEGKLEKEGFRVAFVEPRSDAYVEGLREKDLVVAINGKSVVDLDETTVKEMLVPLAETKVLLRYKDTANVFKEITVVSKEYFKQQLFMMPIKVPGIYGLEVQHFNRKTFEDMFRHFKFFRQHGSMGGLILDFRNNPGGPPLAAVDIASFFLKPGEDFAYFQRKGQSKEMLTIPGVAPQYFYDGPIVVLINKASGSASELFSGVLQKKKRAVLMGENSAGQVMLKSMFPIDDQSMVLLVTAQGKHPDGSVFSFDGITPDTRFDSKDTDKMLESAIKYLQSAR